MRYAMSRRRRNIVAVICALAVIALSAFDHSCSIRSQTKPAQTAGQQQSSDIQKYDGRQFTVVKVIDGDTLDIDIHDESASGSGGQANSHTRIRLWGVDTPETKDTRRGVMYFGPEASEFAAAKALGKQVTIFLDKERNTRDKYHRLLAYVQLPDRNYLNEVLLSEGYAYADLRFKHNFYNKYKQLEALARSQKKGLWAGVTEEQMPGWRQKREYFTAETAEAEEVNN